jgi:hypothetical protein
MSRKDSELSAPTILAISAAFALFCFSIYLLGLASADRLDVVKLEPPAPASSGFN